MEKSRRHKDLSSSKQSLSGCLSLKRKTFRPLQYKQRSSLLMTLIDQGLCTGYTLALLEWAPPQLRYLATRRGFILDNLLSSVISKDCARGHLKAPNRISSNGAPVRGAMSQSFYVCPISQGDTPHLIANRVKPFTRDQRP